MELEQLLNVINALYLEGTFCFDADDLSADSLDRLESLFGPGSTYQIDVWETAEDRDTGRSQTRESCLTLRDAMSRFSHLCSECAACKVYVNVPGLGRLLPLCSAGTLDDEKNAKWRFPDDFYNEREVYLNGKV